MKVLYINAMGPTQKAPLGGIFVSQRILALKKLGVDVIPVNAAILYSAITKALLKLKKIQDNGKLLNSQLSIQYTTALADMSLLDTWKARTDPDAYKKVLKRDIYDKLEHLADVDLIHVHWCWPIGLIIPELAKEKGIPYILTFHGSDINIQLQSPVIRPALLKIMEKASSVEFISNALLKKAIESGYSGKNAVVIYNGIDTEIFCEKKKKKNEKRKKCVGFVGNLIPVKGADRLPDIFSNIKEKYEGEIKFIVVGQGNLKQKIKEQMTDLPVVFTGQLSPDELSNVYKEMDILIVPSRSEGYSCVIKEAQACGVIPIGSDVGGIREAIAEYGSVVSSKNEKELIDFLSQRAVDYLEDKKSVDINQMISDARKCSWIERQKKSLENYERILSKRKNN